MGLLSIIRKVKEKEREIRLLLLGLDNAGKSTVLKQFLGKSSEEISSISPTLGFDIKSKDFNGFMLNIWDVGGQTSIRAFWRNYFEETDGLVFVIDASDRERILECREELMKVLKQEKLVGASVLILANKQDIKGALNTEEIELILGMKQVEGSEERGDLMFKNRHAKVFACSAVEKGNEGLLKGFEWIVQDVGRRMYRLV